MFSFTAFKQDGYPVSLSMLTVVFVLGALAALFRTMWLSQLWIVIFALFGGALVVMRWRWLCLMGWFFLGFAWTAYCGQHAVTQWLQKDDEGSVLQITGRMMDFARPSNDGWQFDFYANELHGKVRLSLRNQEQENFPNFSCVYRLRVKLKSPRGLLNTGQYDYQAWLLQEEYRATGYVKSIDECIPSEPNIFLKLRQTIAAAINQANLSPYASSTISALLIGNYADIDSTQWQVLRDSGTIHLLSVSGLHIVLVVLLFHAVCKRLVCWIVFPVRYWPAEHWASVVSLGFAVFYALITGFSVATQRSLIMVCVAVLQRLFYGKFRVSFIFLMSLLLVVIVNPLSMLSSSFWFTYAATAILLLASSQAAINTSSFWRRYVREPFRIQAIMFVMMVPVLLFVYSRVSILSLPLNMLAVPWVSFLSLPFAFVALLLMPISDACANFFLQVSGWTLDIYWYAMQGILQCFDDKQWDMGGISLVAASLSVIGLGVMCFMPKETPLRKFSLLLCLPLIFPVDVKLPQGEVEVRVLDVGQGLAIVARTARHVMVYDTGDKHSERFDAGRDIVATALRNARVSIIDMLVISHADSDHAGGRNGLLAEIPTKQKWSGTPDKLESEQYLPCNAGMHWRWDGVDFRVLYPIEANSVSREKNDNSCVIQITAGGKKILLTGDIEKQAEAALLDSRVDLKSDVLIAPHHGSKTSSTPAFLRAVNADTVVVSAGYKNRFHHPAALISRRYQEFGMQQINTAEVGAVTVRLTAAGVQIENALCVRAYFWRAERYNAHCIQ